MTTAAHDWPLDQSQEIALEHLKRKLCDFARRIEQDHRQVRSDHASEYPLQHPQLSNVFGILGGRGAGKSTVLQRLHSDWSTAEACRQQGEAIGKLFVAAPLDCSILPPDISPGVAVLLWLQRFLKKRLAPMSAPGPGVSGGTVPKEKLFDRLDSLIHRYAKSGKAYQNLCLELSSSPSDYGRYVTEGLNERFNLSNDLGRWLEDARENRLIPSPTVVILVDDFDLVPAVEVRRWLRALLDELCQRRLLFVLSADYYRLEHLVWDAEEQFDDKTGRALVDKLLPIQNRVELPGWSPAARRRFGASPAMGAYGSPGTEPSLAPRPSLWELVRRVKTTPDQLDVSIAALLPHHPRGLMNLHQKLQSMTTDTGRPDQPADPDPAEQGKMDIQRFLSLLASCRAEPLLARRIKETDPTDWVVGLKFPDEVLTVEEWGRMIQAARELGGEDDDMKPLPPPLTGLVPITSLQDLGLLPHGERLDNGTRFMHILDNPDGTALQDPPRHDRLHTRPLRDASEQDIPRWTELLLDLGFCAAGDEQPEGPCWRRRMFLQHWHPAAQRLQGTRFRLQLDRARLEAFFVDNATRVSKATLLWLHRPSGGEPRLWIGWQPLLAGLRGQRDPLSTALLQELWIAPDSVSDSWPEEAAVSPEEARERCGTFGAAEKLSHLLPGQLRAMLLLIDGLHRCPWAPLSAPLNWSIATYLGLAAALVRTAYVYALHQGGQLPDARISGPQRPFLDCLLARDPFHLLRLQEEEVTEGLNALFTDPLVSTLDELEETLKRKQGNLVLSVATRAYLQSPVYRSVVALLESQPR